MSRPPISLPKIFSAPSAPTTDINFCPQARADINFCPQVMAYINFCPQAMADINFCPQAMADINFCPQVRADIISVIGFNRIQRAPGKTLWVSHIQMIEF